MQMIFIITIISVSFLADLYSFIKLKKLSLPTHFLLINPRIFKRPSFRALILAKVNRHYMAFDSILGLKMKANCEPFRFLHTLKGKKSKITKQSKLKNFFEIKTDKYGFIVGKTGQERNYKEIAANPKIYKILVSGNSVSAGSGASCSETNWPNVLEDILNENPFCKQNFEEIIVINSSGLGNNITQEINRFCNETIFLNPNLVISFSGGATNYKYYGNSLDEIHSSVQKNFNDKCNISWFYRQNILLLNLQSYLKLKRNFNKYLMSIYPYRNSDYPQFSSAQITLSKIKQFKGICDANEIDFIFIFQPAMGVGKKVLTKEEESLKAHFERYFFEMNWDEYLVSVKNYAKEIKENSNKDYQYNFLDIFADTKETVYSDPRHLEDKGHKIVAEAISQIIISKMKK